MITLQAERARAAKNEAELVNVVKQADFFATRMFIPLSIVLLGVGLGMIAVGHIGFNHPFAMIALTGWALSFLIGAGFLGPQSGKVKKVLAAADNGANVDVPAVAIARINRIVLVARLDLVILALVVVNMVVKPGGGIK
jgi:low temperature requirement protein LtrA